MTRHTRDIIVGGLIGTGLGLAFCAAAIITAIILQ